MVTSSTGNADCTCDIGIPCQCYSLDNALKHVENNSIIIIELSHGILLSPINKSYLTNVTIAGRNFSEIDCKYTGALMCRNCNSVSIKSIRWIHCGFFSVSVTDDDSFHNKTHHLDPMGGLYFHTCTDVVIECCIFATSLVQFFQSSGTIIISDTYFTDNYTNTYPQPGYEYIYGGLYVEQPNSSELNIIITGCTFTNTKPNSVATQLFVIKVENFGIDHLSVITTSFIHCINGQTVPSNYGNSMVFISISSSQSILTLSNVRFQSNTINDVGSILSIIMDGEYSTVQLLSCVFLNNTASNIAVFDTERLTLFNSVFINNDGKSHMIFSKHCTSIVASYKGLMLSNNKGGPLLSLSSWNISVSLVDSNLKLNTLSSADGLVSLSDYHHLNVLFEDVNFISNNVPTDGSTFRASNPKIYDTFNNFSLPDIFTYNVVILNATVSRQTGGGHGAGVYISHPSCGSCKVNSSYILKTSTFSNMNNIRSVIFYSDHIYNSTSYMVISDCIFSNNLSTAVHLENSNLVFDKGYTLFKNNIAEHGAALYLDLNSRVTFEANSKVEFEKNEARRHGGAIYCSVSEHNNCSRNISDMLLALNDNNRSIQFIDNIGSAGGDSVYFNVPLSCDKVFQSESSATMHPFGSNIVTSPASVRLEPPAYLINYTNVTDLSAVNNFYAIHNIMLGQSIVIPTCLLDYNGKPAGIAPFLISHIGNTQRYSISGSKGLSIGCESFQRINDLQIVSSLPPHRSFKNYFSTFYNSTLDSYSSDSDYTTVQMHSFYDTELKPIIINIVIEISTCHAGFHYITHDMRCVCYTRDNIVSCSGSNATIRRGYWFGTVDGQATVGVCPVNYCNFDGCDGTTLCPMLPSINSQCGEHRSGTACGRCKNGYTLSFDSVLCVNVNKCSAGITVLVVLMTCLYWIITIITVFAMMYFKIGIGYLYSITFYYSVIDILLGNALHTSDALYGMVTIMSSLAKLTPKFLGQFCFVKGLSGIDQQFLHYIHPLAVLLLLFLISISTRFSPRLALFVSRGVIHVICFLLLLSYTSIASTSLLLIKPLTFIGVDKVYTYLSPDYEYFHGRHLAYGLVAIVCGLVIVIGFPLILLLEPFVNHKINFTRIKPILDQFQGYYKDKYRYFASYYMICRLVMLLIVNTYITNVFTIAYLQLVALIIMALIHFIVRPYVSKTLNAVDGLFLLTMILVSLLQPFEASNGFSSDAIVGLSFSLVVFPLLVVLFLIFRFIKKQNIKMFIIWCVSILRSSKAEEPVEIVMQNTDIQSVYEVTVDDARREATTTTIV